MNSSTTKNRQILLASRPDGEPSDENFKLLEVEIPRPGPGQMLVRTIYLSLDPYMRGRMNAQRSYAPPVEIGEVMEGQSVCEVMDSNVSDFRPGDIIVWCEAGAYHLPWETRFSHGLCAIAWYDADGLMTISRERERTGASTTEWTIGEAYGTA